MLAVRACLSVIRARSLTPLSCVSPNPYLIPCYNISTTKAKPNIKTPTKSTAKSPNSPTKANTKTQPIKTRQKTKMKPTIFFDTEPTQNNKKLTSTSNQKGPTPPPASSPLTNDASSNKQTTNTNNPRVHHAVAPDVYPIIAIVGRPNVGKSTLFNRFALGEKRALIGDVAGTTRDRDYASCRWYGRDLIVVDTGGIVGEGKDEEVSGGEGGRERKKVSLAEMVRAQAMIAIREASTVVFVLDIHDGVTQHDLIIARMLRKRGKRIVVVVNKADNQDLREFQFQEQKVEYERLGFGPPIVTSAIHGEGFLDIIESVVQPYPETPEEDQTTKEIRIAIVGQPNAGKSSLLNKITGEERAVVSPIAGTTSDPVDTLITWRGSHRVRLIDTAGIWKRANDALARAAVIWALRVVQRAHVVILVIDATVGVTEHDKHVAGFILEHMKSVLVAVNKWDIFPKIKREREGDRPKKEKMSHYEWLLHAQDLARKVMSGDRAGIAAWERGDKKGIKKKHWKGKEKDKMNKDIEKEVEEEEEEEERNVEVVKRNAKQSSLPDRMSELTKELLESEEKQHQKAKYKKGTSEPAKNADDEIDFEKLEESATEFAIPLSSSEPPPPLSRDLSEPSNDEKAKEVRKKRHKPTQDEMDYEDAARAQLKFLPFVPFSFISATTGYRVPSLMDLAVEIFHERGKHIKTQDMFEVLRTAALRHKLPGKGKNLLRVRFASQVDAYPPTFVFFVNNPDAVQQHYERFLETCIREKYQFLGTPIRLIFKKNSNKYTQDKK